MTSEYGTAQIAVAGYHHTNLFAGMAFEGRVLEYLAPLLPVILVGSVVMAWWRKHALALMVVAVCGSALVFDLAAYLNGGIIDSYRYFIAAVPLEALLVGCLLARPPMPRTAFPDDGDPFVVRAPRPPEPAPAPVRTGALVAALSALVAIGALVPSIPATAAGMFNPKIGSEESNWLGFVVHGLEHHTLTPTERTNQRAHAYELQLGAYIAHLDLPRGDVLVDNFDECITPMLTSVENPKVFVIPNDRDYRQVLDAPLTFHAHYILVAPVTQATAVQNTIDKAYPGLYRNGADFARLVHQYPALGDSCPAYRLYRVVRDPGDETGGAVQ